MGKYWREAGDFLQNTAFKKGRETRQWSLAQRSRAWAQEGAVYQFGAYLLSQVKSRSRTPK